MSGQLDIQPGTTSVANQKRYQIHNQVLIAYYEIQGACKWRYKSMAMTIQVMHLLKPNILYSIIQTDHDQEKFLEKKTEKNAQHPEKWIKLAKAHGLRRFSQTPSFYVQGLYRLCIT
jgi:hypothetical protein